MTQDEIIRMAREAGISSVWAEASTRQLERFASLVAANEAEKWKAANKRDYENWKMAAEKAAECEREACAKVCEENGEGWADGNNDWCSGQVKGSYDCAAAIRARGDK